MKNIKFYIAFSLIALGTASCTKVIDLKLGNDSGILVIEGNITNVTGAQYIMLSQNVPFTNTNTYPPVTGATVFVSDNKGNNYPFTEGPAGTYSISQMTGTPGITYSMHVTTKGTSYTAASTMPAVVALDSITSTADQFGKSNQRQIMVHYQDPAGEANEYRFIMYINGVQVDDVFAYNDEFINGRYVNLELFENNTPIYTGDTATVVMQCIDQPIYTYWFSLMQQQQNSPGGGVTPSNPPTNITPATLGYFSAHTTQTETIVVK